MKISEIYERNAAIRKRLFETVDGLSDEAVSARPDDEKWSVGEFVEHIAIVHEGFAKICRRLLSNVGETAHGDDAEAVITLDFAEKSKAADTVKLEAPDIVRPSGARSIAESKEILERGDQLFAEIKPLFSAGNASDATFPHPFFGPMNSHEWLLLAGGHEDRHIGHIQRVLGKLN